MTNKTSFETLFQSRETFNRVALTPRRFQWVSWALDITSLKLQRCHRIILYIPSIIDSMVNQGLINSRDTVSTWMSLQEATGSSSSETRLGQILRKPSPASHRPWYSPQRIQSLCLPAVVFPELTMVSNPAKNRPSQTVPRAYPVILDRLHLITFDPLSAKRS